MASPISANRAELLAIATSVANEKLIDKAIVIEAMEEAIQKSARSRYGAENDIRAKLDPRTGDLRLWRVVEVVEEVEDYFNVPVLQTFGMTEAAPLITTNRLPPEVRKPGISVRPVVQAMMLIGIHHPAHSSSLRRISHWVTPRTAPRNGPTRKSN